MKILLSDRNRTFSLIRFMLDYPAVNLIYFSILLQDEKSGQQTFQQDQSGRIFAKFSSISSKKIRKNFFVLKISKEKIGNWFKFLRILGGNFYFEPSNRLIIEAFSVPDIQKVKFQTKFERGKIKEELNRNRNRKK